MKKHAFLPFLTAVAVLGLATPSESAPSTGGMFLKITDVTGSVENAVPDFEDSVAVVSFSFGTVRHVEGLGSQQSPQITSPEIETISFVAEYDPKAFAKLMQLSLTGTLVEDLAVFHNVANFQPLFVPMTMRISGVISSISMSRSGNDGAGGFMEISFTVTKVTVESSKLNDQGDQQPAGSYTWDALTNTGTLGQ